MPPVAPPTAADLILRRLEDVKALLEEIKHHAEQMREKGEVVSGD